MTELSIQHFFSILSTSFYKISSTSSEFQATKLGDKLERLASSSTCPAFLHPLIGILTRFTWRFQPPRRLRLGARRLWSKAVMWQRKAVRLVGTKGRWTRIMWRHVNINFCWSSNSISIENVWQMLVLATPKANQRNSDTKYCILTYTSTKPQKPHRTPTEKRITGCNT